MSATGLITGSIAPDCEKFLRLRLASNHSHTFNSIFYFSCPVALVLAFAFHLLVRKPLLRHLPPALYRRLGKFISFDWTDYFRKYYLGVTLSIIVGAALHLFWDSFTHPSPFIDQIFPLLARPVWVGDEQTPFFYLVGLASSVLGGAFIIRAVWQMPVRQVRAVPTTSAVVRYWSLVALVTIALATQWIVATEPELLDGGIAVISSSLVGLVAASLYTTYTNRKLVHERL
ncbi:hypothetical protein A8B98_10655 [Hymenobacter sp. UV11]|nr:hypothetical protein A8B98_10655 [Hymenobacter sp. UV11]